MQVGTLAYDSEEDSKTAVTTSGRWIFGYVVTQLY